MVRRPGAQVIGQVLPSVVGGGTGLQFVSVADFVKSQVLGDVLCELDRVATLPDGRHHQLVVNLVDFVLVWKDDDIALCRLPDSSFLVFLGNYLSS